MMTITDKEFKQLSQYIHTNYGIHLKEEKKALIIGRLANLLLQMGMTDFSQYYQFLIQDNGGDAASVLLDKITTNHTFFMREAEHFYYLRDRALPDLAYRIKNGDFRMWCAASSTGEEPYTLAMILSEFTKNTNKDWDKKILATDISNKVLETAKRGIYDNERIMPLPKYWKVNYFKKYDSSSMVITEEIKNEVIFRRFNLMEEVFPFRKKFHVIFCRNVMIYFDAETKEKLIIKMCNLLEPGGYLFVGHSEGISRDRYPLHCVSPSVYRKI